MQTAMDEEILKGKLKYKTVEIILKFMSSDPKELNRSPRVLKVHV